MVLQRQRKHFCFSCYPAFGENINTNHVMSYHIISFEKTIVMSCHGMACRGREMERKISVFVKGGKERASKGSF